MGKREFTSHHRTALGNLPPTRRPTLGNRQSGMGNRGGRPPHTAPYRLFSPPPHPVSPFPRFPIPDCRFPRVGRRGVDHSPFPIAHSQGKGGGVAECLPLHPSPP